MTESKMYFFVVISMLADVSNISIIVKMVHLRLKRLNCSIEMIMWIVDGPGP